MSTRLPIWPRRSKRRSTAPPSSRRLTTRSSSSSTPPRLRPRRKLCRKTTACRRCNVWSELARRAALGRDLRLGRRHHRLRRAARTELASAGARAGHDNRARQFHSRLWDEERADYRGNPWLVARPGGDRPPNEPKRSALPQDRGAERYRAFAGRGGMVAPVG